MYTHYFSFGDNNSKVKEKLYQEACLQISKMVFNYSKEHGGIAGYTAHATPGTYKGINFNGSRDNGCEAFVLREILELMLGAREFCKTNRQPYDVLVTAALCILHHYLPKMVAVGSDGDYPDWAAGAELAKAQLGVKVLVPPHIRRTSRLKKVG
jgi:hypothetical protein